MDVQTGPETRTRRKMRAALIERFNALELSENTILMAFALAIGVLSALGVVAFYKSIDLAYALFYRLPADLLPVMEKLVEFNTSGSPTFLQHAAIAAIRDGEPFLASFVARCRAGRDVAIDALAACRRVEVERPSGAFYAFPRIDGVKDSLAFAKEVLVRAKVGLAPGSAFGPMGEGYLRLCFARDPAQVAAAVERLRPLLD